MNNTEKAYPNLKGTDRVEETCGRCGGHGAIGYGNVVLRGVIGGRVVDDRICFECHGRGTHSVLVSSIRAREARAAKAEAKQREGQARYEALLAEDEAKRLAAEAAKAAAEAARRATATPVPTGRVAVEGKVVGIKWVAGYSYYAPDVKKIVVEDDRGFKVYGSCPSAYAEVERGEAISFTATLEPSHDDELFGFFKRPTTKR